MLTSNLFFSRATLAAFALLLTLVGGVSAPLSIEAATATVTGTVELSPGPPALTQAVPPNIIVTFDDSGSMQSNRMSDYPPFSTDNSNKLLSGAKDWSGGPWRCANVIDADHLTGNGAALRGLAMNGVYYNPNITYGLPAYANGTNFPNADVTLNSVWQDGLVVNRPLSPVTTSAADYWNNSDLDQPSSGSQTNLTGKLIAKSSTTNTFTGNSCPSNADQGSCVCIQSRFIFCVTYQWTVTTTVPGSDTRWQCGTGSQVSGGGGDMWSGASPMDGASHTLSDGSSVTYPNGGPYYYRLKTGVTVNLDKYGQPATTADLTALYTLANWEAVPVPAAQYQNFANWFAYYRTRNQMARSSLSLVFGALGAKTTTGGFGNTIRAAWQNLNVSTYNLPAKAIISSLIDTAACTPTATTAAPDKTQSQGAITTPPDCYRSAFFNWIYQVPASGGTPTRSAVARAGEFFKRGSGNTGTHGNLQDPYWQPGTANSDGTVSPGNELYCRQNYQMLITDGLWNGGGDGPKRSALTLPDSSPVLPDGVTIPSTASAGVSAIYASELDAGDSGYASLSDIGFNYWATNLRPDLYIPASQQYVTPYMVDSTTGVVSTSTLSGSTVAASNVNNEIYFNPANDPASWPHMSEYMVGLGVSGQLNYSTDTNCAASASSDACLLRKGLTNSSGAVGWPVPNGSGGGVASNIDDTWHAALAGRGQFFSAGNPQDLVNQLTKILSNISARNVPAATSAVSAAVLTTGTLGFSTGYNTADWSGLLDAVGVNADGTSGAIAWDAGALLTASNPANRVILSATLKADGTFNGGVEFKTASNLDSAAQTLLMVPASVGALDTVQTRVDWLRGIKTSETNGTMRQRTTLLGAMIRSQADYVSFPAAGYRNTWPLLAGGTVAPETAATNSPIANTAVVSYEQFSKDQSARLPVVYVGANDGMLHAFDASQNADGTNTSTSGSELWAYVPRSAYSNLGNLTSKAAFAFAPTVDATPITRDVFFAAASSTPATTAAGWHTILVGSLGQGGRGIYALDVTDPNPANGSTGVNASNVGNKVLWEFNAGMPVVASTSNGTGGTNPAGNPADLGYTYGQPNVSRLANGKWVVLVPGGYFPDCTQSDKPVNCAANNTPPTGYSALFILDAQTGALISELKTPTTYTGVTSYGLSSPVLGDYNNDQIDDVAFAGDLAGNLWRYDLTNADPSQWKVVLAYQPTTQGAQPITVMPRLFPDPVTNRFIVVFGTGKYIGAGDNSTAGLVQAVYGIRDTGVVVAGTSNLVQQTLSEAAGSGANANNTIRGITSNPVPANYNGWYFNLYSAGERVVVTPGALFDTNRAVITTLIPNNSNGCTANNDGALMIVDAGTGGAGDGLPLATATAWSTGVKSIGGRVVNPPTGGSVPVATSIGGGKLIFPGINLKGGGTVSGNDAIWRRRSWRELLNNQ